MPFIITQGQQIIEIDVSKGGDVYFDENPATNLSEITRKEPEKGKKMQVEGLAVLFINENGREVKVAWVPDAGSQPVAVKPNTQQQQAPNPISTSVGQWQVRPFRQNISDFLLGNDFQDAIQSPQSGTSCNFKTSSCGLDEYLVSYEPQPKNVASAKHVVVQVRKRIICHYFEMERPPNTEALRPVISEVQSHLEEKFGIELSFSTKDGKVEPDKVLKHQSAMSRNNLNGLLPNPKGRPPRDLWVISINKITGAGIGSGGGQMAAVSHFSPERTQRKAEGIISDWMQYRRNHDYANERVWVKDIERRYNQRLEYEEQQYHLRLALGKTTPEMVHQEELRTILLHEIGHSFGLVPVNELPAGTGKDPDRGWHETNKNHARHCSKKSCIMYWQANDAQGPAFVQIGEKLFFDHEETERCALYLKACDLTDLSKY